MLDCKTLILRHERTKDWHPLEKLRIASRKRWRPVMLLSVVVAAVFCPEINASLGVGIIEAHITRLRNNHGQVICSLFTPSDQFPERSRKGMTMKVPIQKDDAICRFKDVRYGDYAIVAFHDENHDGEFNQNWLGMPKEGFGFSQNPGTLKKPVFGDARFTVDQPLVEVTIKLNYWF